MRTEDEIGSQLPISMPPIVLTCDLDPAVQKMSDRILADLAEAEEKQKQISQALTCANEIQAPQLQEQLDLVVSQIHMYQYPSMPYHMVQHQFLLLY